jgi:hypothetical protein
MSEEVELVDHATRYWVRRMSEELVDHATGYWVTERRGDK